MKLKETQLIAWYTGTPEYSGEYLIKSVDCKITILTYDKNMNLWFNNGITIDKPIYLFSPFNLRGL